MTKKLRDVLPQDSIAFLAENFLDYLEQTIHKSAKVKAEERIQDSLDSTLKEFGFTDEGLDKAKALFNEAVSNKDSQLRSGIAALLGISPIIIEAAEVIDALADRIAELENQISFVEQENRQLASELRGNLAERHNLDESTVTALWDQSSDFADLERNLRRVVKTERTPKKSFVDEQLEEINEDTTFAKGEEYVDPRMAPYLRYFR
jgi:DNA-directed RNA polymerase specialized sigma54-like protein